VSDAWSPTWKLITAILINRVSGKPAIPDVRRLWHRYLGGASMEIVQRLSPAQG